MLIVRFLTSCYKDYPLSQGRMTLIKAALVNADILGFLCLDFGIEEETVSIVQHPSGTFEEKMGAKKMNLWKYMRHSNRAIAEAQTACHARYVSLHSDITTLLRKGQTYPWVQLTQLNVDKFFSDIIESLIGAIFIDSAGSLPACEKFLERIGLMPYLRRVVSEPVNLKHPRAILEQLTGSESIGYNM